MQPENEIRDGGVSLDSSLPDLVTNGVGTNYAGVIRVVDCAQKDETKQSSIAYIGDSGKGA